MSAPPLLLPTSRLVAEGWVRLAVPGVGVGSALPTVEDQPSMRSAGFVRIDGIGGSPDRDVRFYSPTVFLSCWFPPAERTGVVQWTRADQLAERLKAATYDGALRQVLIEPPGNYAPARVHTAIALAEPDRVEEEASDWARSDIDITVNWTPA